MTTGTEVAVIPEEVELPVVAPGVAAGRAFLMPPANMKEAMELATTLSKSTFVPRDFKDKPGDVLCAIQFGAEVGLPPLQALQGIAVVNGKPSVYGDAAMGLVETAQTPSGDKLLISKDEYFELNGERIKTPTEGPDKWADGITAVCVMHRRGRTAPCVRTFSVADAKRAKTTSYEGNIKKTIPLWQKDTYQQYPQRMLQMRARAWVIRDEFSDVIKGLAIREEAQDYPEDVEVAATVATPRALAAPAPAETGAGPKADPEDEPYGPGMITRKQQKEMFAKMREAGKKHPELKEWLGREHSLESSKDITQELFPAVLAWITGEQPSDDREPGSDG